jgi:hypothetical protein
MNSALKHTLIASAMVAVTVAAGCKSDGSYREQQKTAGDEVEAREEHGETAIDEADEADEPQGEASGGDGQE